MKGKQKAYGRANIDFNRIRRKRKENYTTVNWRRKKIDK